MRGGGQRKKIRFWELLQLTSYTRKIFTEKERLYPVFPCDVYVSGRCLGSGVCECHTQIFLYSYVSDRSYVCVFGVISTVLDDGRKEADAFFFGGLCV